MKTLGIDAGMETVKTALLEDGAVKAGSILPIGARSVDEVVAQGMETCLGALQCDIQNIEKLGLTGTSAEYITTERLGRPFAFYRFPAAGAKGMWLMDPAIHSVIDMGASSYFVFRCKGGFVAKSERNTICASGTGRYMRTVAHLLGLGMKEMGAISAQKGVKYPIIGSTCAVFSETEIISLMHAKMPVEDIVRSVYMGVVSRALPLMTKVRTGDPVAMTGGLATNKGLVKTFGDVLGIRIVVPKDHELIGAIGAGLLAQKGD